MNLESAGQPAVSEAELRLLGPVEVGLEGRLIDVGHARQLVVLAALAVEVTSRPRPTGWSTGYGGTARRSGRARPCRATFPGCARRCDPRAWSSPIGPPATCSRLSRWPSTCTGSGRWWSRPAPSTTSRRTRCWTRPRRCGAGRSSRRPTPRGPTRCATPSKASGSPPSYGVPTWDCGWACTRTWWPHWSPPARSTRGTSGSPPRRCWRSTGVGVSPMHSSATAGSGPGWPTSWAPSRG